MTLQCIYIDLSLDPDHLFETGVAVNYSKTHELVASGQLVDEPERGNRLQRIKMHALRRFPSLMKWGWETELKEALKVRQSNRNEIMRPPINPVFHNSRIDCEWLQEYFVKGDDLEDIFGF